MSLWCSVRKSLRYPLLCHHSSLKYFFTDHRNILKNRRCGIIKCRISGQLFSSSSRLAGVTLLTSNTQWNDVCERLFSMRSRRKKKNRRNTKVNIADILLNIKQHFQQTHILLDLSGKLWLLEWLVKTKNTHCFSTKGILKFVSDLQRLDYSNLAGELRAELNFRNKTRGELQYLGVVSEIIYILKVLIHRHSTGCTHKEQRAMYKYTGTSHAKWMTILQQTRLSNEYLTSFP